MIKETCWNITATAQCGQCVFGSVTAGLAARHIKPVLYTHHGLPPLPSQREDTVLTLNLVFCPSQRLGFYFLMFRSLHNTAFSCLLPSLLLCSFPNLVVILPSTLPKDTFGFSFLHFRSVTSHYLLIFPPHSSFLL